MARARTTKTPARSREPVGRFLERAESILQAASVEAHQAEWVYESFINGDTEALTARAESRLSAATLALAKESTAYDRQAIAGDARRQIDHLRTSLDQVAPSDPLASAELTRIRAAMTGAYGKGKYRPRGKAMELDLNALSEIIAKSREPTELEEVWLGWHKVGAPMRPQYVRFVELANQGAREIGFSDTGAMWRAKYDMPPEAFTREIERLWETVRPLYERLHAFVRRRLSGHYGPDLVPERGTIPAHLLGNMWAQTWSNLLPIIAPPGLGAGASLTETLKARKFDERELVRVGEKFFVSLGFRTLPASFWERSQFTKPLDREVVCHASAWDLDNIDDLRVKMCIEASEEDFEVIHHELGHCFYDREYNRQPLLYRQGAHDGFHEAVGDTIALSITPEYLGRIGLAPRTKGTDMDLGMLLRLALEKIAFLPFAMLVDRWRWDVFRGAIPPREYNRSWWELRRKYQGVSPPVRRSERDFDPGAKMHVPANVPYMRYFLADILQFQFHRGLAEIAGHRGPLHRFSVYGNRAAGARLIRMFRMGSSRPWPEALEVLTGSDRMDPSAMIDYFRPLMDWLDQEMGQFPTGW